MWGLQGEGYKCIEEATDEKEVREKVQESKITCRGENVNKSKSKRKREVEEKERWRENVTNTTNMQIHRRDVEEWVGKV